MAAAELTIHLDAYAILTRALEEGLAAGWRRAHKYTDTPDEATILDELSAAVRIALSEVLRWPDESPAS